MNKPLHPRVQRLLIEQEALIARRNRPDFSAWDNGIIQRYEDCIITDRHVPISWRFDMNPKTNPLGLERLGINVAFNSGAIYLNGKFYLVVRTEGRDRKSFFAVAESPTGIDQFRFWDEPCDIPEVNEKDAPTNVYDMRLTQHEDGWIYGIFCVERKDPNAPDGDLSSAVAQCGIVRTKDLKKWERLPDFKSPSNQQRNVVLHPEFVNKQYAFYTRPQDSFIEAGKGGGIGWAFSKKMNPAVVSGESAFEPRQYHTIKEMKNGQGPAPIKTKEGWLHLAHGVRGCASGLRYVLYMFMTSLDDPSKVIYTPGGYFMAPEGDERIGDVSNVVFANGWVATEDGSVYIYYASSDTRMHVATSSIEKLVDFCKNTPSDPLKSHLCVKQRVALIRKNKAYLNS